METDRKKDSQGEAASFSPRKILGRYYYAFGFILLLLGLTFRLLPRALHKEGVIWETLGEMGSFLALVVSLHLVYELLIKQDEHQVFISELRKELNDSIKDFLKKSNKNRFKLVFLKRGGDTKDANNRIKEVKTAIRATHFTHSSPSQKYIGLMCEKMKTDISVYRIVASEKVIKTENIDLTWLEPFKENKNYTEYQLKEGTIPFDFCIFDNEKIILYFPFDKHSQSVGKAIIFDDQDVASIFGDLFEHLVSKSKIKFDGKQLRNKEQEKKNVDNEHTA